MASATDAVSHVQAKFFTKQKEYSIPDVPYSLPITVSSEELNDIISNVLYEDAESRDDTVIFDFLIDGELLRTTLEVYLEDKEISTESVFEIEYIERQAAPRPEASLSHDDWVSCVRGKDDLILCGCYDNTLKLWSREGQCLTTIPAHSGPVKCVTWLNNEDGAEDEHLFASSGHDQTMFLWRWKTSKKEVDCLYAYKGHAASVDCIAANSDGERIVTGSWDKMIKLWTTTSDETVAAEAEPEEARQAKKLKSTGPKLATRVPLLTLSGHKEAVTSAVWLDSTSLCTASWDHTLRTWDMTEATETQTVEGSKAFFQIAHSPLSNLIVSASADRHVRIHDLRTKEMKGTYTGHAGWVSSVDWSRNDENLFISGSHDCFMKLWDTRSPKAPLYVMIGQEDKILAVDWSIPDLMLSGGADNQLRIFNYKKAQ